MSILQKKPRPPLSCMTFLSDRHCHGLTLEETELVLQSCAQLVGDDIRRKYGVNPTVCSVELNAILRSACWFWTLPDDVDSERVSGALGNAWLALMTEIDAVGIGTLLSAAGHGQPAKTFRPAPWNPTVEKTFGRDSVLAGNAATFAIAESVGNHGLWAAVQDEGALPGRHSIILFANGVVYVQSPDGLVGGFAHETIRMVTQEALKAADAVVPLCRPPPPGCPFPPAGQTFFYILTATGPRLAAQIEERAEFATLRFAAGRILPAFNGILADWRESHK